LQAELALEDRTSARKTGTSGVMEKEQSVLGGK
jgi:hypothetical protein